MCCGDKDNEETKQRKLKYKKANYADPNYEGEPTDNALANGPYEQRSCTDICCCMIFFAYMVGMGYIAQQGFSNGSPQKLMDMYDSTGAACGRSLGYEDYKYIYFWMPVPGQFHKTTCVKECNAFDANYDIRTQQIKDAYEDVLTGDAPIAASIPFECKKNPVVNQCYGKYPNPGDMLLSGATPGLLDGYYYVYPTVPYFEKVCFPKIYSNDPTMKAKMEEIYAYINSNFDLNYITELMDDIRKASYLILISIVVAFFMGMVWMVVMKMCAAIITWTTIIVVQLLVVALTYLLYTMGTARKTEIEAYPEGVEKPYNYTLYVSYGAMVVCGIMFCAIVCMYNKIRIVIKIMETSADFVTEVCTVMLVPPIMMLLTIVWSLVWIYLAVYVYSNGEIAQAKPAKGELYGKPYGNVTWTDEVRKQFYAFVFGFIWICCFFDAMNQFLIASTACIWYFSPRDPNSINDKMVTKAVTRSVFRCLCYHIGTLAFGSFLVAVVKSMQLVLRYVEKQAKKAGKLSKPMEIIINCCSLCLWCFEKFIKFINKNAYIQCAITSHNFCVSAKDAFFLITRNSFLFAIAEGIGAAFILLGKLFIAIVTTIAMYYGMDYQFKNNELQSKYGPLIVIAIISWITGSMFMSVWGMAADSILQCFCIDKELNHGSGKQNLYCPGQLLKFVEDPKWKKKMEKAESKKKKSQDQFTQKKQEDPEHGDRKCCSCC